MIEYIKGELVDLTPTCAIVETNGIGYSINISLVTYSELSGHKQCKLYVYEVIREDAYVLYGFTTQSERTLFLLLISVSGVGANTARMIMSSLSASELQEAIATENSALLKNVKGIGLKTAQRIIVDLRDKVTKTSLATNMPSAAGRGVVSEAVAALVMLGFQQSASQKVVEKLANDNSGLSLEQLIKKALQML
jgi:holliday junction DNA helicase RuvA